MPISTEKAHHELCRCPRIEDRPCPVRFHRQGGGPQNRDFARCILGRCRRHHQKIRAEKPRAARLPRRAAGQDRRLASRQQGQAVRHERLYGLPQGDRLSLAGAGHAEGRDSKCRRGNRQDLRTAARRAPDQRPLRAERGECALGLIVRRLLRHRRDPARSERRRQRLQQGARRQGDREGKSLPRCRRAARDRQPHRRDVLQRDRRPARGEAQERQRHRAEDCFAVRRLSRAMPLSLPRSCWSTTACMSK